MISVNKDLSAIDIALKSLNCKDNGSKFFFYLSVVGLRMRQSPGGVRDRVLILHQVGSKTTHRGVALKSDLLLGVEELELWCLC